MLAPQLLLLRICGIVRLTAELILESVFFEGLLLPISWGDMFLSSAEWPFRRTLELTFWLNLIYVELYIF